MKKALFLAVAASFMLVSSTVSASEGAISHIIKDPDNPTRVFVGSFTNESGQNQLIPEDFKKSFADAVLNRKSVNFDIVKNANESDIQVSCAIKKYLYSKTDPINSYAGAGGLVLDAVTTENYVEMSGEFTVIDTKTGKTILKENYSTYIEKMMTPEESILLIYEKLSRIFIGKAFGKPKR